jgi:hypothetical protein
MEGCYSFAMCKIKQAKVPHDDDTGDDMANHRTVGFNIDLVLTSGLYFSLKRPIQLMPYCQK